MLELGGPVLSVIVPCHGLLRALRFSGPPLLADEKVEFIVVDHNCPNWCGNFARAYWPLARVMDLRDAGEFNRGRALNLGVRAARGRWLAFLDPAVVMTGRISDLVPLHLSEEVMLTTAAESGAGNGDSRFLVCSAAAFARAGGYNEQLTDAMSQESDLCRRLLAQGVLSQSLPPNAYRIQGPGDDEADGYPQGYTSWVRWPNPITVGIAGPGFGDILKSVQYAYHLHLAHRLDVSLYPFWHGARPGDFRLTPLCNREILIEEILDVLDVPRRLRIDKDRDINDVYVPDCWPWHFHPQSSTRRRWQGWPNGHHRRMAYQFDGVSAADKKNATPAECARILDFAPDNEMVRLGKNLSVRQCVDVAAQSDLFVGVDSGMIQLCYAVGVPVFLLRLRQDPLVLYKWHGDHHAIHCDGAADFIHKARQFLGMPGPDGSPGPSENGPETRSTLTANGGP